MKVFRELTIRGRPDVISATLQKITGSLAQGWQRDEDAEQRISTVGSEKMYCFHCSESAGRPAAALWLCQRGPCEVYVSNIVPSTKPELSCEEYNSVMEEFYDRFVKPAVARTGAVAELTSDEFQITEVVSREAMRLLHQFSVAANKFSGASHPMDQERWFEFLLRVHRDRSELSAGTLERWLEEHEGWPPDQAHELAARYEYARSLLQAYDRTAVNGERAHA